MRYNKYLHNNWDVTCDVCNRKRKVSETTPAYGSGDIPVIVSCLDGCADYRHPLNSPPPVIRDNLPVPNARPDVPTTNPSIYINAIDQSQKWGSFHNPGTTAWGSLGATSVFSTEPVWYWGSFP